MGIQRGVVKQVITKTAPSVISKVKDGQPLNIITKMIGKEFSILFSNCRMELITLEEYMKNSRKLTKIEKNLLIFLIQKSNFNLENIDFDNDLLAEDMDDGGMGSLKLYPKDLENKKRIFGKTISDYSFLDIDGITVIVSLNLDKNGKLFELDVWKTDYSPVIKFPEIFN
jgi:hypothetical protein